MYRAGQGGDLIRSGEEYVAAQGENRVIVFHEIPESRLEAQGPEFPRAVDARTSEGERLVRRERGKLDDQRRRYIRIFGRTAIGRCKRQGSGSFAAQEEARRGNFLDDQRAAAEAQIVEHLRRAIGLVEPERRV